MAIGKLGEKEKKLYENIKIELNSLRCKKDCEQKQQPENENSYMNPNQKVVSKVVKMDDFYTSFI